MESNKLDDERGLFGMRVRFFGEPWPSPDLRAFVCEDEKFHVSTPTDHLCVDCEQPIEADDRGVIMAAGQGVRHAWTTSTMVAGYTLNVCAAHIDCHIKSILPGHETKVSRKP